MTYRPRLNVEITQAQSDGLRKHLEFGMQKLLIGVILDDLLKIFDKYGVDKVIGALVEKAISLKDVCKLELKDGDSEEG